MDFNILNNKSQFDKVKNIQPAEIGNISNSNPFKEMPIQDTFSSSLNNESELKKSFEKIKKQQGLIGKLWDGFKNIFGMKSGSKYVQKIIEQADKGEITKEEAQKTLDKYNEGQKTCVDVAADIASGILSVGAFALAVPTGGASLAIGLAVATATGAGIKIGIKGIDAVLTGKEYKGKDLFYDFATGAINGVMAPVTNGLGNCVTKTIGKKFGLQIIGEGAEQAVKQTAKSVILTKTVDVAGGNIAKRAVSLGAGMAVDGALGGASDNMVRAALNGEDIAKAGIKGAIGGLIMSPVIGGGFRLAGKIASKMTKQISSGTADIASGTGAKIGDDITDSASGAGAKIGDDITDSASGIGAKIGDDITDSASGAGAKIGDDITDSASGSGAKIGDDITDSAIGTEPKIDEGVTDSAIEAESKIDEGITDSTIEAEPKIDEEAADNALSKEVEAGDVQSTKKKTGIYDSSEYQLGVQKKINELRVTKKSEIRVYKINGESVNFEVFINSQLGSNEGYFVINQNTGELFYAKLGGNQSGTEILASKIYKAAGLDVPELSHFVSPNGESGVLSKYVPNITPIRTTNSLLYDGFAMDALLANWDAVCSDNAVTDGINAIRIDLGGTFDFRAQGGKKPFSSVVDEITTLINPSKNFVSANIFAGMTRDDLIASLQKVVDLDDEVIKKILKDEGLDRYTEVLLKRKEFLTDLLAQVKNTPNNGEDIFSYITKVKNQTFDVSISKIKTQQELNDIQISLNQIQDINVKKKLQKQLDQKGLELTKSYYLLHKQLDKYAFSDLLTKSGIMVKEANGSYIMQVSSDLENKIIAEYGQQASYILHRMKSPITPEQYNNMLKLINVCDGKYIEYFTKNLIDFVSLFQVIKSSELITDHFDKITPGQWDAIFNLTKYKVPVSTLEALRIYKLDSENINSFLTTMRKISQGEITQTIDFTKYQQIQQQIKALTDYIDTQAISEPMNVYRGEGYDVLDSIIINGQKLSNLMMACGSDSTKISHLIDIVEQGNYVATQERFMSTSLVEPSLLKYAFFKDEPIIWDMDLPVGTKGVFLEGVNLVGSHSDECEYLIQRGSKIRIKKLNFDFHKHKWYIKGEIVN